MSSVEQLIAHTEICNAKSLHIRLLDTRQFDAYAEMLTDDYELDISAVAPIPVIKGRDYAMTLIRQLVSTATIIHHVHLPTIEIDGDQALAIWPMQDITVGIQGKPTLLGFGYHHDRWSREGGRWKCAASRLTRLHSEPLPSSG